MSRDLTVYVEIHLTHMRHTTLCNHSQESLTFCCAHTRPCITTSQTVLDFAARAMKDLKSAVVIEQPIKSSLSLSATSPPLILSF